MAEARLILICGLPGSGKTTLAKQLALEVPAVRLCPDEWKHDLGIDSGAAPIKREDLERWSQQFEAPDAAELALFDEA